MTKIILKFFDRLEDNVRSFLSKRPLIYAFLGGVSIVLFWRGVWHTADYFELSSASSLFISLIILFSSGLFVSFFIGDNIILTGLKHEKKLAEKTETEVRTEKDELDEIKKEIDILRKDISLIKEAVTKK